MNPSRTWLNVPTGRTFLSLAILLAACMAAAAAPDQPQPKPTAMDLAGNWLGALKIGAIELRLALQITKQNEGSYKGTLDSLDQGAKDIPFDQITLKEQSVTLEIKRIGAKFEGKLKPGGTEMDGEWKQGGRGLPITFLRQARPVELKRPQLPKKPYPYGEEEVVFENKKAGVKLAGTLTLPRSKQPCPAAILISGSGPQDRDESLMGHKPFLVIADHLTRHGVAVLRYDDRGVAKSTGSHSKATSEDFADDVQAAVDFLKTRKEIHAGRIGLIGHSEGGIIAPMVAARSADVAFIILLAGTAYTGEEVMYQQGQAVLKSMGALPPQLTRQRAMQEAMFKVARSEKDQQTALKKLRELLDAEKAKMTEAEKKELDKQQSAVEAQFRSLLSPWFQFFLTYDPRPALRKVRCPVLALNGDRDVQVVSGINLSGIEKALKEGGNQDITVKEFAGLNHLFQPSKTGAVSEYGKIEETIAPSVLELMSTWILKRTGPQA